MDEFVEDLVSFVPGVLVRRFATDTHLPGQPWAEVRSGAVLFADVSGFTAIAESMARKGAAGAEGLTQVLNRHFGRLINLITAHGGEVMKFAGDAVLAFWPAQSENVSEPVLRAANCGLAAQEFFEEASSAEHFRLSTRIGVGCGVISIVAVGGVYGRWCWAATGGALGQLAGATHQAEPGEVVLSPEAWEQVSGRAEGRLLRDRSACLTSIHAPGALTAPDLPPLSAEGLESLRSFLPAAVVLRLRGGRTEWLGELRTLTILFIHFPGLTHDTAVERAQSVMHSLQSNLYRYEGSINKLSVDDKGTALLAALGLPPLSHEDDAVRGVRAAMDIRGKLRELHVNHAIGVATGRTFCGVVGNAKRREYTMIGDVVNLAARLMQAAPNDILCDEATYEASKAQVDFEPQPPITLKGKTQPVAIFRPLAAAARTPELRDAPMVGRAEERKALAEHLDALILAGASTAVVIEGEAGMGKSRLMNDFAERARSGPAPVLRGYANPLERATPYFAWREIFSQLLGVHSIHDEDDQRRHTALRVRACAGPKWNDQLALLNPVLRAGFPETEATSRLTDPERSKLTKELLVRLLATIPDRISPKVILLEDGHWLDTASWELALLAARRVKPLLLVLSARASLDAAAEYRRIPSSRVLRLAPLPPDDAIKLACGRLGIKSLPDRVAATIHARAEGNPLFVEELAYALRDAGVIVITGDNCRLAAAGAELSDVDITGTVQAAITSRIDRLAPAQQLILKVASVIGRVFEVRLLRHLYPLHPDEDEFEAMLADLARRGMLVPDPNGSEPSWAFKHAVFQTVAYNLMLFSQRRDLHRAMAEWIERNSTADRPNHALLAHHWGRVLEHGARDRTLISKVLELSQHAGEQALRSSANQEAAVFLKEALRLLLLLPEGPERDGRELGLQCMLGGPLIATRGFAAPEVERAFTRAWELCSRMGRTPQQFGVLAGLWGFFVAAPKLEKAHELAEELLTLAGASDDPATWLPARRAAGETAFWRGDLASADEHFERLFAAYHPEMHEGEAMRAGLDPAVVCLGIHAWTQWLRGFPERSVTSARAAASLAAKLRHPLSTVMRAMQSTVLSQMRRDAESREQIEAVIGLSREEGFELWSAGAAIVHGWALAESGDTEGGITEIRGGLDEWEATGMRLYTPYYLALLSAAYERAGRRGEALAAIEEAAARSEATGEGWWRAEILRLRGVLRGGDQASFREAIDLARRQGAKSLELRALCSLARLRPVETRAELQASAEWFQGHDTPDLRDAKELLAQ
jgi:class 3 adenylate cyclase/predicted ATPase